MREYSIDIKLTDDGIYEEDIDTIYYGIAPKQRLKKMSLNKFIKRLYDDHWIGTKVVNDSANIIYSLVLQNYNVKLSISIPKDENYIKNHSQFVSGGIELLKQMCKDAEIINNNVINFNDYNNNSKKAQEEYRPNLKLIKGTKYNPSIKKVLKTKKGKIILGTIIGFTIIAGTFIAHTIAVRADAQEVIDNNQQISYQSTQDSDNINREKNLYQAIQNGKVESIDNNQFEEMKKIDNEQNYQIRR